MKNEDVIKVFGIGFPKTGTTSLAGALNILGLRAIHDPNPMALEILEGKSVSALLQGYNAVVGGCKLFEKYYNYNPNAKFILTVRDPENWLRSARNHFSVPPKHRVSERMRQWNFDGCTVFDENIFKREYEQHNRNVISFFEEKGLPILIFDCEAGDNWDKLCSFTKLPVPSIDFPLLNSGRGL